MKPSHVNPPLQLIDNKIGIENLLTVNELAGRLKVSPKTIYGWHYRGIIRPEKLGPRLIRFSYEKVLDDLQRNGESNGN